MRKSYFFCVLALAATSSLVTGVAKADNYDICYQKIKEQFGPYTDITWMRKVWDCTAKLEEKGGGDQNAGENTKADWVLTDNANCNFNKKIAECQATATVSSSKRSGQSFMAEITIESSAEACSKVIYRLNNKLKTTLIERGDTARVTLSAKTPITSSDVTVSECGLYENATDTKKREDNVKRYGRCLGDRKWMAKLDEEYVRAEALISGPTLVDLNEYVTYFARTSQSNEHWIRRKNLIKQCL